MVLTWQKLSDSIRNLHSIATDIEHIQTEVISMHNIYIMTGILTDDHTIKLFEALPLTQTRVRLVIEPLSSEEKRPYKEVIMEIRQRQRIRGYQPLTRKEVDAYLQTERDSWEK